MKKQKHPTLDLILTEDGRVYSMPACKWLKPYRSHGHLRVGFRHKGYFVHRLMVETFIGPIPAGMQVDHINRVRDDNHLENLRIVTPSENRKNTEAYDQVEKTLGVHWCDDPIAVSRAYEACNRIARRQHCRDYHHRVRKFKLQTQQTQQ